MIAICCGKVNTGRNECCLNELDGYVHFSFDRIRIILLRDLNGNDTGLICHRDIQLNIR